LQIDLKNIKTNKGLSLYEISQGQPLMVVFLRNFGCVFCREALHDISDLKPEMKKLNINLVFVHMSDEETANSFFNKYGLPDVKQISDPTCDLYGRFGLSKGNFSQLLGLKTWVRGFEANLKGIPYSLKKLGDSLQMPGIFLICDGVIRGSYIHKRASDRPNYLELFNCCVTV